MSDIDEMVVRRLIKVTKHPTQNYHIYNYTPKCSSRHLWNEATMMCRGLVLAGGKVVARPFQKFFELSQLTKEMRKDIDRNAEVITSEKMDGSLGILYWIGDMPHMCTRGSFTSEQAVWATGLLQTKYIKETANLDKRLTYLFEIVYPDNRIVINYDKFADIILLGAIVIETGQDIDIEQLLLRESGFILCKTYPELKTYNQAKDVLDSKDYENKEGFVVTFKNELKLKLKRKDYKHKQTLADDNNFSLKNMIATVNTFGPAKLEEQLSFLSDSRKGDVLNILQNGMKEYGSVEQQCKDVLDGDIWHSFITGPLVDERRSVAQAALDHKHLPSKAIMNMYDNREYSKVIWDFVLKRQKESRMSSG